VIASTYADLWPGLHRCLRYTLGALLPTASALFGGASWGTAGAWLALCGWGLAGLGTLMMVSLLREGKR
jgi:hypothetical protein